MSYFVLGVIMTCRQPPWKFNIPKDSVCGLFTYIWLIFLGKYIAFFNIRLVVLGIYIAVELQGEDFSILFHPLPINLLNLLACPAYPLKIGINLNLFQLPSLKLAANLPLKNRPFASFCTKSHGISSSNFQPSTSRGKLAVLSISEF